MIAPSSQTVMRHSNLILSVLLLASSGTLRAQTRTCAAGAPDIPAGHAVFLEEDNFQAHPHTDRNYTMGLGFQTSGGSIGRRRLDLALNAFDDAAAAVVHRVSSGRISHPSAQRCDIQSTTATLAGTAFTPAQIRIPDVIVGDRPYAFLLGWTVRRVRVDTSRNSSWSTEATVGTIGSPVGRVVQTQIHRGFRAITGDSTPFMPRGWGHQILNSPTGIPTARYAITHERVVTPLSFHLGQTKVIESTWSATGEVGYYTTLSAGAQLRIGQFDTPFWLFTSDPLGGANRAPTESGVRRFEWFLWGRGAGRAVGYNALLQGYGSWLSDYVISPRLMRRKIGEYAYGATVVLRWNEGASSSTITWVRDAMRTSELGTPFGRSHYWGSIFVSWSN